MMRSLYAGVSGLQNHQTRMDVIGNNVANVNTIGFKKGRVNFQDMISQNVSGAARPNDERGGVNPKQIGLGMQIATIDTIHTQGSLQSTGVVSDLAITGNGFFILRNGDQELYSRAGAFGLDADGTLVNPSNGMAVQGWAAETVDGTTFINTSADIGNLKIPIGSKDPAQMTTEVDFACNLNKNTPILAETATDAEIRENTWVVNKKIYDTFGNKHILRMDFVRIPETTNQWQVTATIAGDSTNADEALQNPANTVIDIAGATENGGNVFVLNFDNAGALASVQEGGIETPGDLLAEGTLNISITYDVPDGNPDEAGDPYQQTFNLNLGDIGSYDQSITQQASKSTTKAFKQNGYGLGYLESYKINKFGEISGVFTNGQSRDLGKVALGSFVNNGGLEKTGETNFRQTINSGEVMIDPAGVAGKGTFVAGTLEMSNVDLAEQFVDMIVTQRGFQANSKSITTSDTMLQELLTLKR